MPSLAFTLRSMLVVAATATAVVAGAPAQAASNRIGTGMAGVDSEGPGRDSTDGMWATAKRSSITSLSVVFQRGALGKLPASHEAITFGKLTITQTASPTSAQSDNASLGSKPQLTADAIIPATPPSGDPSTIQLTFQGIDGVTGKLRLGTRPSIAISGLPADSVDVNFSTTGTGRRVIRNVARCRKGHRPGKLRSVATYATGETHVAAFNSDTICGKS